MKKEYKRKCKYCKSTTHGEMCGGCREKLKLVRKLLKMVNDTFERYGRGGKNYG